MLNTRTLRIGAVICAALAVFVLCLGLFGGMFSKQGLEVTRKYVSGSQFHVYSESPKRHFAEDRTVSREFYDAVRTGDHIRSPIHGYLQLVRDGRTIQSCFTRFFVVWVACILAASIPLVVFFKPETFPFRKVVWPIVALLEFVIISKALIEFIQVVMPR